jgi:hypothetical protein
MGALQEGRPLRVKPALRKPVTSGSHMYFAVGRWLSHAVPPKAAQRLQQGQEQHDQQPAGRGERVRVPTRKQREQEEEEEEEE